MLASRCVPVVTTLALLCPATAGAAPWPHAVSAAAGSIQPGQARAFRAKAPASGGIDRLSAYVDASSRVRPSSRLIVGVFAGSASSPTKRLGRCSIRAMKPGAWNTCAMPRVAIAPGRRFWVATLQPAKAAGLLQFQKVVGHPSVVSSTQTLAKLPKRWQSGRRVRANALAVLAWDSKAGVAPSLAPADAPPVTDAANPTSTPAASPTPISTPTANPSPSPSSPSTPISCTLTVNTRAALLSAVQSTANGGKTVCARAADYGTADFQFSVRHTAKLTLAANPGERVTIPGVVFQGASNMRVQGFDMPRGGFTTNSSASTNIDIVRNEIHDCFCEGLHLYNGDKNFLFEGNYLHGIHYNDTAWSGWGVVTNGGSGGSSGLKIRYNTFDGMNNDAMQIGDSDDGEIIGNVIKGVAVDRNYSDPHPDGLMLWAGAQRWLIKDNRFSDGRGWLMSGSTTDVRVENNLIVRADNLCVDGGPTGSSSEGLVRYTWVRNTIYDCGSGYNGGGFGGDYGLSVDGAGSGNVLDRNLLTSAGGPTSQYTTVNHNLIKNGSAGGSTDKVFTPAFANQIDYQATNLPAGYEDVGYRPVPAGYTAAP